MSVAATALPVTTLLPLQSVGITPLEASLFVFILITALLTALFRDVLASIVVFAAYSLGLAVLYTVYRAPDVGLTEAAIGAGVTTVFLLLTIAKTTRPTADTRFETINWPAVGVCGLFVLVVGVTLPAFPAVGDPASPILANADVTGYYLANAYDETGAENAVTAVLAAYRGFDTFGEAIVVFAAGIASLLVLGREVFTA
jgi:Multisubunit Na+/H+ antiporter, MnhB subunit